MFCTNCGKQLDNNAVFCPECGERVSNVPPAGSSGCTKAHKPGKKLSGRAVFGIIAGVLALIGVVILIIALNNKAVTAFNIEYTEGGVEKFLNRVCKNIDAQSATVSDVEKSGYRIVATLEIKLKDKSAQEVKIYFSNVDDSDKVQTIRIDFDSSDSAAEYNCKLEVLLGLEKTLGKSRVGLYLSPISQTDSGWTSPSIDEEGYWISDSARVHLHYESGGDRRKTVSGWYILTRDKKSNADMEGRLVGTWEEKDYYYPESWEFLSDSTAFEYSPLLGDLEYSYSVASSNTLKVTRYSGWGRYTYAYLYSEAAKDGDKSCWYIEGNILYLGGKTFVKK